MIQFWIMSSGCNPERKTKYSAGYDMKSAEHVVIKAGEMKSVDLGCQIQMDDIAAKEFFLDLRIRSGLAFKHLLTLQNACGVIDGDYKENIKALIKNEGTEPFVILKGDRVVQAIISPYTVVDDDSFTEQERTGGFGSTGRN